MRLSMRTRSGGLGRPLTGQDSKNNTDYRSTIVYSWRMTIYRFVYQVSYLAVRARLAEPGGTTNNRIWEQM